MTPAFAGIIQGVYGETRRRILWWWKDSVTTGAFLGAVILCGLIFGGAVAGQLNPSTTAILGQAMQHFIAASAAHQLANPQTIWAERMFAELKLFGLIWLSGISLLGLPIVTIAIFLRAFQVGFSIAYSVLQFGWHGLLVATLVIFVHQVIALCGLWCAGILAVRLSASVFRKSLEVENVPRVLIRYTLLMFLCLAVSAFGAFIQAFAAAPILSALLPH